MPVDLAEEKNMEELLEDEMEKLGKYTIFKLPQNSLSADAVCLAKNSAYLL